MLQEFFNTHSLVGKKIAVGLSGGPDSVFLLHHLADLYHQKQIDLIAAHLDHEWRSESGQDALFCQQIAFTYNIPFIHAKASELFLQKKYNGSKEEMGRNLRRMFFNSLKENNGVNFIALAHHFNDQQETFFIRMIRGAGITGLSGMNKIEKGYIRPLLEIRKETILTFLNDNNIPYLIDATNNSPLFLRNRIRNSVLPALRKADNRFDQQFASTLANIKEADQYIDQQAQTFFNNILKKTDTLTTISVDLLLNAHQIIRHRVIILWLCHAEVPFTPSKALIAEIERFLNVNSNKSHLLYHRWKIQKKYNFAWIEPTHL